MRASSAAFAAAVASHDSEPVTVVTFAFPASVGAGTIDVSKAVQSYQAQTDLTTDMPTGSRNIEGYPSRSATLVLSGTLTSNVGGEANTAQALFDDWSPSSPLYGYDWTGYGGVLVTVQQGLVLPTYNTPELYTQMTAWVDNMVVNRKTGEVTFTLSDNRPQITTTPQVPAAFALTAWNTSLTPNPIFAPGLTAVWPLDYILRANGIYSCPPPRPTAVAYMSLHGSVWPEICGVLGYSNTQIYGQWVGSTTQPTVPNWVPGNWCGQIPDQLGAVFPHNLAVGLPMSGGTTVTIEGWCRTYAGASGGGVNAGMMSTAGDASFTVYCTQDSTGLILTLSVGTSRNGAVPYLSSAITYTLSTVGFHQLTYQLSFPDDLTTVCTYYVDGVSVGTQTITAVDHASFNMDQVTLSTGAGGVPAGQFIGFQAECWQWMTGTQAPSSTAFVSGTQLGASLNNLVACPSIPKGTDGWNTIQALVDAEGAVAGFDETNLFYFRNRNNIATATSQATVTSTTQIKELVYEKNEANRARTVQCNAFPVAVGQPQVVWTATQTYVLPAHGNLTIIASLQYPSLFVPRAFTKIPTGGLTAFTFNGVRLARAQDGSGSPVTFGSVVITATPISSTAVRITMRNANRFPVYLVSRAGDGPVSSNGQPALNLVGIPILPTGTIDSTGNATGQVAITSTAGSGIPVLAIPDSPWRQDALSVQAYTDAALMDLYKPRPMLTTLTIVGDPRLQLGDRVTVQDLGETATGGFAAPATMNDDIIITGIRPQVDRSNGFTQTLLSRTVVRPASWVGGVTGRSEMGVTTRV